MSVSGAFPRADRRLLTPGPDIVAGSRALAARSLADADLSPPLQADVLLVVSELVSNAARHTSGPVFLAMSIMGSTIRIEVADSGDAKPPLTIGKPQPTSESGRGLLIIDVIATRWGVRPEPDGKTVWAEIDYVGPRPTLAS